MVYIPRDYQTTLFQLQRHARQTNCRWTVLRRPGLANFVANCGWRLPLRIPIYTCRLPSPKSCSTDSYLEKYHEPSVIDLVSYDPRVLSHQGISLSAVAHSQAVKEEAANEASMHKRHLLTNYVLNSHELE